MYKRQPEGCASILWKDPKKVKEAAESLRLTAYDMKRFGVVEEVIFEKGNNFTPVYRRIRDELEREFARLLALPAEELLESRYQRFRKFGE